MQKIVQNQIENIMTAYYHYYLVIKKFKSEEKVWEKRTSLAWVEEKKNPLGWVRSQMSWSQSTEQVGGSDNEI